MPVAQLAERRADQNVIGHHLLDGNGEAGQVAGETMDVIVEQVVGILRQQVEEEVRDRRQHGHREVDDGEEDDHLQLAPERLEELAIEEDDADVDDDNPPVDLNSIQFTLFININTSNTTVQYQIKIMLKRETDRKGEHNSVESQPTLF